ncbi:hypothetical protein [Flavobacterium quisquiliarum]|uniref:YcxB-like protein n=1 Tax=Flavobacterium quisquiliarum TaxID=1834436 RepID=A0ABV8W143_9FLAO|nr:hypothetical protein [Flavobacterium quisquiliarum]MBW1655114.1 hypothetical protein [Flavobacterium quisquiliarum]NWL02706.1 hypothetical protein [Flavobacterium collinsii]
MKQYHYKNNILNLKVKKSPFLVRLVMFLLSFSFFVFPIFGAIFSVVLGFGLHIGFFIGIGIFSLLGFYLLRMSLWNTYGEETISFFDDRIIYEANYGWFKDGKKETVISNPNFYAVPAGYEEDNVGVLIIASDDIQVESVVKMPILQLEELIKTLTNSN